MTPLRREERLRLERKVVDVQKRLLTLREGYNRAEALWRAEADKPDCDDALYDAACRTAVRLLDRIEDEERELAEALDLLASDDRSADFASWARERGAR